MASQLEDEVVEAVCQYLLARSWTVVSRAKAVGKEHGVDLAMARENQRLIVEAKGATSSDPSSRRYGKPFSSGQVHDHVAKAVLKAMRVVSSGGALAAIAVPDNADHRREVQAIGAALEKLKVGVFWVSSDRTVTLDATWTVDLPALVA